MQYKLSILNLLFLLIPATGPVLSNPSGDQEKTFLAAEGLPRDEDGWTVITPSADSRIIYVSSSEGDNSNDGLSPEHPVATIEHASNLVRDGYPDHILLKCGDVWEKPDVYRFHSGRSATEPMVISYYGDSIKRPLLLINSFFLNIDGDPIANLAVIGLEFYAWKHDPNSPDYSNSKGIDVFRFVGGGASNILIEDCVCRYASLGAFHGCCPPDSRNANVALRRNIVTHAWIENSYYAETGADQRISGFYASEADDLLIEDCLFDHNGYDWQIEGAGPNMFNHNIYLQNNCNSGTIIRNNILARGSAHGVQLRGGGNCSDNVFIQNSVNLNLGGHDVPYDSADAYSYVRNNVFYEGRLMDSTNIAYPRTGANVAVTAIIPGTIENNILCHSLNEPATGIGEYVDEYGLGGSITEINNIEYNWTSWGQTPDPAWFDPDRKLAHYNQNLGGDPSTEAFLEAAAKRPLHTLWPEYAADAVIRFFRTGFSTDTTDIMPPSAPDTISVTGVSDVSAELVWSYGIDDQRTIGYNVYIGGEMDNEEMIRELGYKISGLSPETAYMVWVKSVDVGENESQDSVSIQFMTLEADTEAPTDPANLTLTGRWNESLSFAWTPSTDNYAVNGYKIYLDGEAIPDLLAHDSSVSITGLTHSTEYAVKVSATDNSGNESGFSNEVTARTVDMEKPGSPQNVHIVATSDSTISLAWDPATDNVGVVLYHVFLGGNLVDSTGSTSILLTGLVAGTRYSINVAALDAEGNKSRNSPPLVVESLSIGDHQADVWISIYPVPARHILNIEGRDPLQSIEIFDLTGRKVLEQEAENTTGVILNIEALTKGIYLLRIKQKNRVGSWKIQVN